MSLRHTHQSIQKTESATVSHTVLLESRAATGWLAKIPNFRGTQLHNWASTSNLSWFCQPQHSQWGKGLQVVDLFYHGIAALANLAPLHC